MNEIIVTSLWDIRKSILPKALKRFDGLFNSNVFLLKVEESLVPAYNTVQPQLRTSFLAESWNLKYKLTHPFHKSIHNERKIALKKAGSILNIQKGKPEMRKRSIKKKFDILAKKEIVVPHFQEIVIAPTKRQRFSEELDYSFIIAKRTLHIECITWFTMEQPRCFGD